MAILFGFIVIGFRGVCCWLTLWFCLEVCDFGLYIIGLTWADFVTMFSVLQYCWLWWLYDLVCVDLISDYITLITDLFGFVYFGYWFGVC